MDMHVEQSIDFTLSDEQSSIVADLWIPKKKKKERHDESLRFLIKLLLIFSALEKHWEARSVNAF